jgi:hypothetical protein
MVTVHDVAFSGHDATSTSPPQTTDAWLRLVGVAIRVTAVFAV